MNAQFQIAQLPGVSTPGNNAVPPRIFRLTKPLGDQAVVVNLGYDQKVKVDFSGIANEKITLVRVGDRLIILFDNKSTLTVEPFFDSRHDGLANLKIEVAPGREVSATEFANLFPITTDQSVLPAAGEGNGNAQGSGANFSDSAVDPLGTGGPLDLLGQESLGSFALTPETFNGTPNVAPSGSFTLAGVLTVHDETLGVQLTADDRANPILPAVFQQAGLIGWAESAVSQIASATVNFGTNGPGTVAYVLTTSTGAAFAGVNTGLKATATGNEIFLFTEGNLVVAREGNGTAPDAGGAIAFALYLDPVTLKLSVAQYEAVQHGNALDPNDRIELADVVFVQQVITDALGVVITQVSTDSVGVAFDDDGPAILVTVGQSEQEGPTDLETLSLDESIGNDPAGSFPHGTVDDVPGNTAPDPTGSKPIGRLETTAGGEEQGQGGLQALFNVVKDPGTDGEKSTAYQYSFSLTGGSGPSGSVASTLHVTDPNGLYGDDTIYLFKISDTEIVGRVGNDPNGAIALRITLVNADSLSGGQLVVEQYMAIDHGQDGNQSDSSESLTLISSNQGGGEVIFASLGITLTATITDVDNDTATSSATIQIAGGETSSIRFQDDGPVLIGETAVIARVDEDGLAGHNADAGRTGEVTGTLSATGSAVATGSLASLVDFGTDGAGATAFQLTTQATPFNSGLTSQGGQVFIVSDGTTLHGYVESGNGSGFTTGDREVFTLTVGSDGSYTFALKDQLDHPSLNGAAGDNSENALATGLDLSAFIIATDGDGDSINLGSGTFKIEVQDDIPVLTGAAIARTVDEDDILTPWSQGTSPNDGSADGSTTEGFTGAAIVSGTLAGLVSVGADETGAFGFSSDAVAKLTALGLYSKQSAQGDGENGKLLTYAISNGPVGSHEIIITGNEPNPNGNPVFSLTLNTQTGAYEFRLYDELIHTEGSGQNSDLRSGPLDNGVQHSIPNIDLGSIVTFTDRDGDTVTLTGKFTINVTDDVPHADIDLGWGSVTIDETPGNQADDTTSNSVRNLFADLEATFVNGERLVGDDPDVSGDNNGGTSGNGAIAYARSDFAVVIDDSTIGADHPPYPRTFSLSVAGGNGTDSGLFVTDGGKVVLSVNADGLIIGTVSDPNSAFNGKIAFAIAIESDGKVSVAQYLSIKHDDRGDSNETNDNGTNWNDASPDDALTIQQTLAGKIIATVTVTDSDGDQSSDSVNIGSLITFLDDGPSVEVHTASGFVVVHDETPGVQQSDDDTAAQEVRNLFADVHDKGSDPHLTNAQKVDGAIGFAQSEGAALTVSTSFGADGAATSNSRVFSLTLNGGNGTYSGLVTTDGKNIYLFKEGELIVGRYDGPDFGSSVSNSGSDPAAFAVAIDPVTGKVSVVQYVSLQHNDGSEADEFVAIASNKIFATVTITDGDGDTARDSADISGKIRFEDDGPTVTEATISVAVDEDGLLTGNLDANRNGETLGTGSAVAIGAAGALNALVNFGADGPDSPAFKLAVQNSPVNTGLESKGGDVFIVSDGTTLRGYVNQGGNSGYQAGTDREVFTLTVGSNGSYVFTLKDQLDHPSLNGAADDNTENVLSTALDLSKYIVATDGDGDTVKLATGAFAIQIRDDIPIQVSGASVTATVEEDDLSNANSGGNSVGNNEDGSIGKTVANGSLTSLFKVGADENGTFVLDSNGISALQSQNLTSHNTALSYSISGDTLTAKAGNIIVFTLQIQSNGSYTLTLKDQLDHAAGNGENPLSINLSSVVRFVDFDSDGVTLSSGFTITVQDDVPVQTQNSVSGAVQEDALTNANSNGQSIGNPEGGQTTVATGSLAPLVSVGADETGTFSLAAAPSGLPAITSKGAPVLYAVAGNTLTGYVDSDGTAGFSGGDRVIFTLNVQSNGSYTFTLKDQIDHQPNSPAKNDGQNLVLNLSSAIQFTDADKDTITLNGGFTISIEDDIPVTSSNTQVKVDEDDLAAGNHDTFSLGDDGVSVSSVTGTLNFSVGADEPASVSFASLNGTAVLSTAGTAVRAAGTALVYLWDASTNTLYATPDGTSANAAFKIQVTNVVTGAYSFSLLGQLNHPAHDADGQNNGPETAHEDNIDINLTYTVTDRDGDSTTGTLSVSIDDDMPILTQAPANLITNGDFSQGSFTPASFGGIATNPAGVTGWVFSNSTVEPPSSGGLQVERVNDGYLGLHTSTLGSMIDMGASPGNVQISQQLSGLVAGQTYAVQFEAGAPFPSTAKLEVIWNNVVIGTIDPAGPMTSYSYVVTATGIAATDKITFREVGLGHAPILGLANEGYHGTYLANVAIYPTSVVDEDGLKAPALSVGNNDSQIGDNAVPNTDGDNNEATATGNLNIKWGADNVDQADATSGPFATLVQDVQNGTGDRSVTFTDAHVGFAGAATLTSQGVPVTFTLNADHTVLTGSAGGRTVFEVSLSDDGTGSYRFVLFDQLDHAPNGNENDIVLTFNYTATDSDGDAVSSKFIVSVDDDVPVQTGAKVSGNVDEDELTLANSNNSSVGNPDGDLVTTVATGSLTSLVSVGADEQGTFSLIASPTGLTAVTSKGAAVLYSVAGTVLTGYVDSDGTAGFSGGDRVVFTLDVQPNGNYTFTLKDQIDHLPNAPANDDNQKLILDFTGAIQFTDQDGDTIRLQGTTTTTTVTTPLTLQPGHYDTYTVGGVTFDGLTFTGTAANSFVNTAGDNAASFNVSGQGVGIGNNLIQDNQGFIVERPGTDSFSFTINGSGTGTISWVAYQGGVPVSGSAGYDSGTLTLPGDGSIVTIDPAGTFDHLVIRFDLANGDKIRVNNLSYTSTTTTSGGVFTIGIEDDIPVAGPNLSVTVDEDDLATGNHNTSSAGDDAASVSPVTGTLNFAVGADEAGTVSFASLNGLAVVDAGNHPITAGNQALHYFWDAGTTTLYASTQVDTPSHAFATAAFKIQVNPSTGAYSFSLLGQVDHPVHDDPNVGGTQTADEDNININLSYTVTDRDGDAVKGALSVSIDDDMPIIAPAAALNNLVVNGSFEQGHGLGDNQWSIYHSLPRWTTADIGVAGPNGDVPFEVQTGNVGGVFAQDGNALVELDSDFGTGNLSGGDHYNDSGHTNATIQQVIAGTHAGEAYELTFYYSPRPNEGNADSGSLNVLWNGQVVKSVDSTGITAGVWQLITVSVVGTGAGDVLAFQGTGQENSLGAYIDNVSLVPVTFVDEDGLTGPLSVGGHDVQPGDNFVANTDNDANETTSTGYLNIKWGADNLDSGVDTASGSSGTLAQDHPNGVGDRSLTFTNTTVGVSGIAALTSKGEAVVFSANADGTILTGVAGGRAVIEISLSDEGTGAFRVVLKDQLDHATGDSENDIRLTFNYTATDSDGDAINGSFTIGIDDDMPVANGSAYVTGQVDEDDLSAGLGDNSTGIAAEGNGPSDAVTDKTLFTAASLNALIGVGADEPASIILQSTFANGTVVKDVSNNDVKSHGFVVKYASVGGDVVGFADANGDGVRNNGENDVFRISRAANGDITFDLQDQIDHPTASGDGGILELNLSAALLIADFDGDTAPVANGAFTVKVENDIPADTTATVSISVEEDTLSTSAPAPADLANGNPDADATTDEATFTNANLQTLVLTGADEQAVFALNQNVNDVLVTAGSPSRVVKSHGQDVYLAFDGNDVVGYADVGIDNTLYDAGTDRVIFRLIDLGNGDFKFDLLDKIDHNNALATSGVGDDKTLKIDLSKALVATDFDGDTVNLGLGSLTVAIENDIPVAGVTTVNLDEDGLTGGNLAGPGDFDIATSGPVSVNGNLNVSFGADGAGTTSFIGPVSLPATGDFSVGSITPTSVIIQQHGVNVLQITLTNPSTGAYTVTQLHPIDHSSLDGQDGDNTENNLQFTFGYAATDFDGDTATGSFTIDIDDDTPTIGLASGAVIESTASGNSNAFVAASVSGSLAIGWGVDNANPNAGPNDRSVAFDTALNGVQAGLTSNGDPVTYTLSNNGTLLTATATHNAVTRTVFTVSIDDLVNGNYTFDLLDNIDHAAPVSGAVKNHKELSFAFIATDSDGDSTSGNLTVHVTDDVPVAGPAPTGTVTEHGLPTLMPGQQSIHGNLNIDWNADDKGTRHLEFAKDGSGTPLGLSGLTSGGTSLDFAIQIDSHGNERLVVFKLGDPDTVNHPVFVVDLASNASYVFTLFQPLDHNSPNGTTLPLAFTVNAIDGDGDSVQQTLNINVTDDVPTISVSALADTLTVDETSLAADATANFADNFTSAYGADGAGTTTYALSAVAGASGLIDTATNSAVNLVMNGSVVEGRSATGNNLVFALSVDASGNVTLDQLRAVMHSPDSGPDQSTTLSANLVTLTATITDKDGDIAAANLDIGQSLTFKDDAPTASADTDSVSSAAVQTLNFDDLALGEHAETPIVSPYQGFNFIQTGIHNPPGAGPFGTYVPRSGNNLAFIGEKNGVEQAGYSGSAGDPVTIAHTDGSRFTALGAWFSSHGSEPMTITVSGFVNGVLVSSFTQDIHQGAAGGPTFVNLSVLGSVDKITLDGPGYFGFDDFSYVDNSTAAGNVITGVGTTHVSVDVPGADGAKITGVVGASTDTTADASHNFQVTGQYGTLVINENGDYTYTRFDGSPVVANDVFTYTLTDGDGDVSTATLTIGISDHGVTVSGINAEDGDITVHENDLLASRGVGESAGSSQDSGNLTQNGTFAVSVADGLNSLIIGGHAIVTDGVFTATSFTTAAGNTFAVTAFDGTTVSYSYTLVDNEQHASLQGNNSLPENLSVVATDVDGDSASSTIKINIVDDVPTAAAGAAMTVVETDGVTAGVNLLLNDTQGADGATVTAVDIGGGFQAIAASGTTTLSNANGTYTFKADGTWTFDPNANLNNASGIGAGFTYRITDGDGDVSTATQAITIDDGPVAATPAAITLELKEAALSTAGATGSDSGLTSEVDSTPSLSFTAGSDDLTSFAFTSTSGLVTDLNGTGGQDIFWQLVSPTQIKGFLDVGLSQLAVTLDLSAPGSIAAGATGIVTVTATLSDNLQHPNALLAQISSIGSVSVIATDIDGDITTGTVNVNVQDDVPTAVNDTWAPTITGATILTGLLTNDKFGADGVDTDNAPTSGQVTVTNGAHGTVAYNNNGTFTYTPTAGYNGSDSFTYTVKDGDGDTSTATVTLSSIQTNTLPTAGIASASVDDEGLPNGVAGSTSGDDLSGQAITASGTLQHDYNTDGKATSDPISFAPMNGTTGLVGTESVTYSWDGTSNTLTATSTARGAIFTVVVDGGSDNGNGNYVFTLLKPVLHDAGNNENDATVNLTYEVKDATLPNADTATGTLAITIDDDIPVAAPITRTVTEGSSDTNILLILDRSGSMAFSSGVDGYPTRLDLLKAAANKLLDQYDAAGDVKVQIIKFNDTAEKQGSVWLSVADAKTYINGLTADDGTDYDDAAELAPDAFDDAGKLTSAGVRNVSYFISDGQPDPTDEAVTGGELTDWINFVNANDIVSFAVGLGSSAPDTYLDPLAHDGRGAGSGTDTEALIVTDLNQLESTLVGTVIPSVTGSVIDGSIPTSFGADGGYVKSVAIDGKTYTYNPAGDAITTSGSGTSSSHTFNASSNQLTITFAGSAGESFVIDLDDGTYVYTPPTTITADFSRPFTYTLTDNDGDTATATLTINVDNVNGAPVLDATDSPVIASVNEDAAAPTGAVGTLVSSLVDTSGGSGFDNVTDSDGPGLGIAITATNSANGAWYYSTDNGGTWAAVGAVSNTSALLLEANGSTRLYFQPAANFNGTVTDGITFRAWDESTGTAGTKVDTSINGGSSAFSSATDTASVTVNSVNDAPTITAPNGGNPASIPVAENTTAVTDIDATDPDAGQTLTYSLSGVDAAKFTINSSTGVLSFVSAPDFENPTDAGGNNVYDVIVQVSDGNGGTDTQTIAVTVNNANDPPSDIIFTGNSALTAATIPDPGTDITRISSNNTLFTLSSVDPDNSSGFTYTFSGSATHGATVGGNSETFTVGASSGAVTTSQLDYDNGVQTITITTPRTQDPSGNTRVETVTLRLGTNTSGDSIDGSAVANDQVIYGFAGDDTLTGGSGRDSIYGGDDDDTIMGAANDIELDGGSGTDTLRVGANFTSGSNAQIANTEIVQLTAAATLNLANQTEGFKIIGSSGIDTITGGSGNDTINAGAGNDTLTANGGADQFRLATNSGTDIIEDYVDGTDKIGFLDNGASGSGSVNFSSTAGTAAGTGLNGSDFLTVNNISDISNSHDNKVIRINNGQTTSAIQTTTIGGSGSPDDNYVIVFNTTTSRGEIWYDTDWSSTSNRTKVATLDNITTLAQLTNITASDIVVYNSAVDPIILDLDHNGVAFSSLDNGVSFDINGDGATDQMAWTADGGDGILALDLDGSGKIESGNELFTPNFDGGNFADGIAALASLDGNHDGVIDSRDAAFADLVVWQDSNHDGVSDGGELTGLGDLGIESISLETTAGAPIDGQNIAGVGSFTYADGTTGTFVEVDLDASLGTPATEENYSADDLTVFTTVYAEIDHGEGNIDLSALDQPGAGHAPTPSQGGDASAAMDSGGTPAAIAIMHEQAALAMQLAAS